MCLCARETNDSLYLYYILHSVFCPLLPVCLCTHFFTFFCSYERLVRLGSAFFHSVHHLSVSMVCLIFRWIFTISPTHRTSHIDFLLRSTLNSSFIVKRWRKCLSTLYCNEQIEKYLPLPLSPLPPYSSVHSYIRSYVLRNHISIERVIEPASDGEILKLNKYNEFVSCRWYSSNQMIRLIKKMGGKPTIKVL